MFWLYVVIIFWFLGLGVGLRGTVEYVRASKIEDEEERFQRWSYVWKKWQLPGVTLMAIAMVIYAILKITNYV